MKKILLIFSFVFLLVFLVGTINALNFHDGTLVSYYKLDETSGGVNDSHGSNDGINGGATRGVTGQINNAFSFDGSDYVNITNSSAFDVSNITINLWFKPQTTQVSNADIISKNQSVSSGWALEYDGSNSEVYFFLLGSKATTTTSLKDNAWHMLTATYNETYLSIYVDGSIEDIAAETGTMTDNLGNLNIGALNEAVRFFNGTIDEVGIWNKSLTEAEITTLWNGGNGLSYEPPVINVFSPINTTYMTPIIYFNATSNTAIDTWIINYNGTNITGFTINTTLTVENGNHHLLLYANDSLGRIGLNDTIYFTKGEFANNGVTYNSTTLETASESFYLNITGNGSAIATAQLDYNGTNYSATITNIAGDVYNISRTIDIPTTAESKPFSFNFLVGGILQTTASYSQTVNVTNFTHFLSGTPFVNISFKNETLGEELVDGTISSSWYYWLGSGGVVKTLSFTNSSENAYYTFLLVGANRTVHTNTSITYSNSISQQRTYTNTDLDLTNTTTNLVLYLLPTIEGVYVTFQVINVAEQPIGDVFSNVTRAGVLISSGLTDDSGAIAYFLDPDRSYTFTFEKAGYDIYTTTLTPTQTTYTITLGQEAEAPDDDFTRGINYSFSPGIDTLTNGTLTFFNFSLTSSYWDVSSFGFNLTNQDGATVNTTGAGTNGGSVYVYHNTSNDTSLTMTYYWIVTGNITSGSFTWIVFDGTGSGFGVKTLTDRVRTYLSEGIFGLGANSMVILIYLIIFISVGIMSVKFGIRSPATITMVLFGLSFLFEVHLELIPLVGSVPLLTTILGVVVAISLIREYLKI